MSNRCCGAAGVNCVGNKWKRPRVGWFKCEITQLNNMDTLRMRTRDDDNDDGGKSTYHHIHRVSTFVSFAYSDIRAPTRDVYGAFGV